MTTSNRMVAVRCANSSAPNEVGTVQPGPHAALAVLRELTRFRSALFPRNGHSQRYHRMQLAGEKAMSVDTFDLFIDRVYRRCGPETARRVFNAWLARYGMEAVDLPDSLTMARDARSEAFDLAAATGELVSFIHRAGNDLGDPERRKADDLLDKTQTEIAELRQAVRR